jgi:DNA-binding protein HU-beta
MAARMTKKASKKAAPATRKTPARRAAKPKAATSATSMMAAASKRPARKAADKSKAATSVPKPASMTGRLPPIVTLKHLAEWAGYNHDVPKKQAIAMLTGFVADIGRVLKKGSKIRIPDLGILQVRVRPARPARRGRNPATGEEIQIKASKASKKVTFRVAKALKEAV